MVVCDDPNDQTCEQDFESLCPPGWGLCTREQYNNRNDGWNFQTQFTVVGEIHCRSGSGAGHFGVGTSLSQDRPQNCTYGSSRPNNCVANYGCNELTMHALCCAPTPTCGNGAIDAPEETCDDGNMDETDACLNSCSARVPQGC